MQVFTKAITGDTFVITYKLRQGGQAYAYVQLTYR